MSHYKPYPAYKDSGVDWIGNMPQHWGVKPIKVIASCNDDSLPEAIPLDMPIRYVDISAVSHDGGISGAEPMVFGEAPSRARRMAKLGDVVVSTVRTYLKAVASVDEAHADCVYSTGFAVLRARSEQLAPEFLKWLALNDLLIQAVESHSEGLSYPAINSSDLVNLKAVVPGLPEQKRIAAILDRETARIDALIAKKTEFIELLKKKIAALASQPPDSPNLKWVRLSHVCEVVSRPVLQQVGSSYTKLGLFNRGRGIFKRDETDTEDMGDSEFFWIQPGDLILSGQFAWEGAVALANEDHAGCVVSHRFPVIRGRNNEALTEYLLAYFLTAHGDFVLNDCSRGSAGRNRPLNMNLLLGWKIPIPAMPIQCEIARLVQLERRIGERVSKSITLLKERRSAFITAAVTGQIDLRGSP
ncbi:restriction endonuclease subunit S [Acidocella aromatica]|uniref:Type I restriction enzyme S subunit n=1 Tax=Acidocella aromatica TaxID=1303579 RepID=A0A840VCG2_9PROT|nr:restriction endonuclease subunit S [Acidocella aromatica]MBB5373396.1 type I restriction enzyme S subunit [Acidocella aromatica]